MGKAFDGSPLKLSHLAHWRCLLFLVLYWLVALEFLGLAERTGYSWRLFLGLVEWSGYSLDLGAWYHHCLAL